MKGFPQWKKFRIKRREEAKKSQANNKAGYKKNSLYE